MGQRPAPAAGCPGLRRGEEGALSWAERVGVLREVGGEAEGRAESLKIEAAQDLHFVFAFCLAFLEPRFWVCYGIVGAKARCQQ